MTIGKYPATPPAINEEASYIARDGSLVTIRGVEPDRWSVTSAAYIGEILRDGHAFRTRTRIGGAVMPAHVNSWDEIFTIVY
jgi:hypothetical protein